MQKFYVHIRYYADEEEFFIGFVDELLHPEAVIPTENFAFETYEQPDLDRELDIYWIGCFPEQKYRERLVSHCYRMLHARTHLPDEHTALLN